MTTRLDIELPTETITIATDIDVARATELVVEYIYKHDLHFEIDARFIDENGESHDFDFDSELFRP